MLWGEDCGYLMALWDGVRRSLRRRWSLAVGEGMGLACSAALLWSGREDDGWMVRCEEVFGVLLGVSYGNFCNRPKEGLSLEREGVRSLCSCCSR